eukprot:CAMPEP_0171803214 /NCGR_PEP_ID=MMETSP0991-20121206/73346_1 /TAXON_ID=483369 /ORGANISM="non described non described, Strain CCMP2098" /LENGTH=115 /DNA_ID=CAMNT_0012415281 /DNA_START=272 /DNA_END=616 /DNA_ORIENTATION=-
MATTLFKSSPSLLGSSSQVWIDPAEKAARLLELARSIEDCEGIIDTFDSPHGRKEVDLQPQQLPQQVCRNGDNAGSSCFVKRGDVRFDAGLSKENHDHQHRRRMERWRHGDVAQR